MSSSRFEIRTATKTSVATLVLGAVILALLFAAPFLASRAALRDLFYVLTLIALAQFWNLLAGYAGIISIGQQAYVGFGGYMLFALTSFAGVDPVAAILLAAGLGGLIAVPAARLVFRLSGPYLAVGTWVVAEVFRLLFAQVKSLGGGTGVSLPTAVTNESWSVHLAALTMGVRASVARDRLTYWLAVIVAAATIALVYGLLRSRRGLALAAIRDNEAASGSIGIDGMRVKLWVYVTASSGASLVGALIFFQTARISPDAAFSVTEFTAYVLFVVVIGGIGTIEGPILGAGVLYLMRSELADFGPIYLMGLGALAIVAMLFFPGGVWGAVASRFDVHLFPIRRRLVVRSAETKREIVRTAAPAAP
jgi:branched-chain amino acid transport system permease protein